VEVYRLPIPRAQAVHAPVYSGAYDDDNVYCDPADAYGRRATPADGKLHVLGWLTPLVYGVIDERHLLVMVGHHVPPCGLSTTVYVYLYTGVPTARVYRNLYNHTFTSIDTVTVSKKIDNIVVDLLGKTWPEFINAVASAYRDVDVEACGP